MADIATLGINIDSSSVQAATERLDKLSDSSKKFATGSDAATNANKQFANSAGNSAESLNKQHNSQNQALNSAKNLTNQLQLMVAAYAGLKTIGEAASAWEKFDTATQSAANLTGAALSDIKDKATATGLAMGRFAADVGSAFGIVGSKMPDLLKMPSAMDSVTRSSILLAQAAKATGDAMTDTQGAEAITASLNQWSVASKDASKESERVANVLAASAQLGSASISQVVESLRDSGTVAADAGVSIEAYNAMVQSLAAKQILGAQEGTALRNSLTILMTKGAEFKEFGISADSVNPKIVGIQKALENLQPMLANDIAMTKVFGAENIVAAKVLGASAEKIKDLTANLTSTKTASEQAAAGTKMFSVQSEMLTANLKNISALTIDNLIGPALAPSLAAVNEGLTYLAANAKTVAATINVAAEVLGMGGALYLSMAALPVVMTAATAASTAFGMGVLAFSANAGAGASVLTILNTNLYGTGVAAQFAASGMDKLKIAGSLVFAAYAGWEIGTYLYNNFEIARVAGAKFIGFLLVGFEDLKIAGSYLSEYLMAGFGQVALAVASPIKAVQNMFVGMMTYFSDEFYKFVKNIVWLGEQIPGVSGSATKLQKNLDDLQKSSAKSWASMGDSGLYEKMAAYSNNVTKAAEESRQQYALNKVAIEKNIEATSSSIPGINASTAAQKSLTAAVEETSKKGLDIAAAHALQFNAVAGELKQYQDFSAKSKERYDAEKKVFDLLKEKKFVATEGEKEQLIAIEMTTAARKKQGEVVYQTVEQLKKEAESLGGVTEAQKQLNLLQANNASPAILEQVKNYQKLIDLGKNTDIIGKKQIENKLFEEGANLVGIEGERFKAAMELQSSSLDKTSAEFRNQIKLIGDMAEQRLRLQAVQKTAETVNDLSKETAAYKESAAAVELYNAKKGLGVGATDAQAQLAVQSQLQASQAKQLRALQDNIDLSKLSTVQQEIETKRRELGATATAEMAAQYVALNKQIAANNALQAAQKSVDASGLTTQAKQYLDIMQQVGVEDGKRVISLQNQAKLASTGTDRIQSLQQEIVLLKLSTDDQARYNALRDVAPDQRQTVLALQNQKIELDKIQQSWKNTTDSAVNYIEKVATGEMSLKDAFKGFVVEFNKQQIKDQLDNLKKMFSGNSVTLEGALNISDSQVSKDVQAAEAVFGKYRDAVASGTDAATEKLVTGIKDGLSALKDGLTSQLSTLNTSLQTTIQQAAQSNQQVTQQLKQAVTGSGFAQTTVTGTGKEASINALKQAADKYGINQADLLKIAKVESNYNASAQNKVSSAGGLAQMVDKTWAIYGKNESGVLQSKYDPVASSNALARYYQDNVKALDKFSGEFSKIILSYGGHQQGAAGFKSLVSAYHGNGFTRSDTRANVIGNTVGVSKSELSKMGDQELAATWFKQWQAKFDSIDVSKLTSATSTAGAVIDTHAATVARSTDAHAVHAPAVNNSSQAAVDNSTAVTGAAKGAWAFAETTVGASNQIKAVGFNAAAGDKLVNTSSGLPWEQAAGSGGGILSSLGLGDIGSSISGVVGDIKSSVTGFMQPATDLFKGLGDSGLGLLKSGMSLFSGDTKGAISGLLSTGLSAAMPGIGTALSLAVGPVMNKLFASWKVESQNLTANFNGLSATYQMKTISTKDGLMKDKKVEYSAVSDAQNKELNAAVEQTIAQIKTVSSRIGTELTKNFDFKYIIDMVHADTGDFKTQFQRAQATMVKNAFTEANIAGVDTTISGVMAAKVSNTLKSAADGVYDKAFQQFMWRPGTEKYSAAITTTVKDSLNNLIASTDWQSLNIDQTKGLLTDKLASAFAAAGVDVPMDSFKSMAEQFANQIKQGVDLISNNAINPDAKFMKNAQDIVASLDQWNLKPEEVTAYINQVLGLGDAFKLAGMDAGQISKGLIDKAGGIDALSAGLGNFTKNFFTQVEQDQARLKLVTAQTSQTFAALGVQMPATRDGFKKLIQGVGQDLSSPENQSKFAELVKVSDKMAEVYSLQSKLGQAAIDVFGIVQSQLEGLANSISANDIGKMLTDSISKATDAGDAGKRFSEAFADAFRQQMLNVVINTVSQMVLNGIVQPMLTSAAQSATVTAQGGAIAASGMASGGSVAGSNLAVGGSSAGSAVATGGAVAAQGLAGVVGKIKDFLQISAEVLKSDEIKSLMADMMPAMADVGSATYTAVTAPTAITAPIYATPKADTTAASKDSSGGSSAADTATKDAQSLADAYKKWHIAMSDAQSALEGNDLALYKLAETYKAVDLSGLSLVGTSKEVAKSLDTLSPDKLQEIATKAGVTVDALASDASNYIGILQAQEKAQIALNESFDKFTANGDKTTQLITRLTTAANDAGLSTDGAVSLLKSLSEADWKKYAIEYGVSVDTLKNTVSTGTLQGIQDFTAWKKSLNDFIEPSKTAKKITDELTSSVFNAGVNSAEAAKWVQGLTDSDIGKYAQQFGLTDKQLRDLVPSVLTSLDDINKGFVEWKDGLNQYTLSGTKITQVTKQLSDLGISANASNDALVGWVQSVTPAQMQGYADSLGIPADKLKTDVIPSVLGGLQALNKALQDWQVSLMQYTTEGTKSSQTVKQLADIAKGYTNNDIVGWLSKLNVSDVETYAKGLGLTSEELKGLIPQVFELRKAAVDFNESMAQTAVTAGKSKFTGKLKGMDLDLSDVDKWRAEQVKKANEVGGDLVAVESAFGRKRNEVMLKYGQSAIDDLISIYNGLSDKLSALRGKAGDDIASLQQAINPVNATDYRKQLGGQITQNLDFGDEKAVSARIELGDKYRQAILDEVKAKETEIKASQDAAKATYDTAKKAWDDTQALNKDKLKTINAAMDSVATAILDVQGQAVKNTKLQTAFDAGDVTVANDLVKSIQDSLKTDLDAIKTRHEAAQKAIDDEIAAFKDLQKTAQSLRDGIKQDRDSLSAEIAKASGNTTYWQQQASALDAQIKAALNPKDKIDLLSKARDFEKNALQERIDNQKTLQQVTKDFYTQQIDFAKQLKNYSDSLKLSDLSPLTNQARYDTAKQQLQDVVALAKTGDKGAEGKVQGAIDAWLKESRTMNASSDAFTTDFNFAQKTLDELGGNATNQANAAMASIPLDDTAFAKNIVGIQQDSIAKLDAIDKILADTQTSLQSSIDSTKIDDSQFTKDDAAARLAAQMQFEAINLKLQAQLDLANQQLATPAPIAINEAQYATQLNAARQNAIDLLTGLQGTIDGGQKLLTDNLAQQFLALGLQFGLDTAGTTTAVQELGGNLGGRLDAVVTTLNGGLAQVAGSVGAAYEAIKVDVAAAQATAQAAVVAAQKPAEPQLQGSPLDNAIALAKAQNSGDKQAIAAAQTTWDALSKSKLAQAANDATNLKIAPEIALQQVKDMLASVQQSASWQAKLPSYDVGTDFVQGDQIAKIHHGEAVLTPDNADIYRRNKDFKIAPVNMQKSESQSDNSRVESLLAQLLLLVQQLIQLQARGDSEISSVLVEKLDETNENLRKIRQAAA